MTGGRSTEPLAPTPGRLLPVLVVVPAVAAAVRLGRPHYLESTTVAIGFILLCAVVLGLPALFWALDHRRVRIGYLIALGACAGLMAPLALLVTGVLGQLQYGDVSYVGSVFRWGAPVPWVGTVAWPDFTGLAAASAITGGVSGVVYWLVVVNRSRPVLVRWLLAMGVVASASAAAALLP
jgi:hypothetical protein